MVEITDERVGVSTDYPGRIVEVLPAITHLTFGIFGVRRSPHMREQFVEELLALMRMPHGPSTLNAAV